MDVLYGCAFQQSLNDLKFAPYNRCYLFLTMLQFWLNYASSTLASTLQVSPFLLMIDNHCEVGGFTGDMALCMCTCKDQGGKTTAKGTRTG